MPGARVVVREVGEIGLRIGGVQLAGRYREIVPGRGHRDAVGGEDVLAVEHAHRARVLRVGVDLTVRTGDLAPHPVDELGLVGRGAVGA